MKFKIPSKALLSILGMAFSCYTALAQIPALAPQGIDRPIPINPQTGLPVQPATVDRALLDRNNPTPAMIDPQTGLPIAQEQTWMDPAWAEPDIRLTNVDFDGVPVSEVVHQLSELFSNQFDILLPQDYGPDRNSNDHPNWLDTPVHLKLHNVNASEVFGAMNLLFNDDRISLQWVLKVNGTRSVALLQVVEDDRNEQPLNQPELKQVFFVGDMLDGRLADNQEMEDIVDQVRDVWRMAYGRDSKIQYHAAAQLIVVSGTPDEIEFVKQTLQAMKQKKAIDQQKAAVKERQSNTSGP